MIKYNYIFSLRSVVGIKIKGISQEIRDVVSNVIDIFYNQADMLHVEVEIEFLDNLYERRLELSTSEKDRNGVLRRKDFISELNGTMVLPKHKSGVAYILIANHTVDDSCQFISTIIHELTHIYDFYKFLDFNKMQDFDNLLELPDFNVFYYWTEYHARRLGYYFYRELMLSTDTISEQEHIEYIKSTEYPFQFNYLCSQLKKHTNDSTLYIYDFMQFLGRFSVWETLYPEIKLPKELDMVETLYSFLSSHNTFDDFIVDIQLLKLYSSELIYA